MAKTTDVIRIVLACCVALGSGALFTRDIYKHVKYKQNKPEIIQEIQQTGLDLNKIHVKVAVKRDPYENKPQKAIYIGDKETLYKKLENGEWEKNEGFWDYGYKYPRNLQFKIKQTSKISQNEIPGNPKNALEILIDFDYNGEYAEGMFQIKKNYDETKKEVDEWVSNIIPILKDNYSH